LFFTQPSKSPPLSIERIERARDEVFNAHSIVAPGRNRFVIVF
jgi:hypothetical protein